MTSFDAHLIGLLNHLVGRSWTLDTGLALLQKTNLLTAELLVSAYWWAWFRRAEAPTGSRTRETLVASLVGAVLAVGISLIVEQCLPPRPRPIHEPGVLLHLPLGLSPSDVQRQWSSFPSDHAVMFFALAAGLFIVSRPVGVLAAVYTCVVTALPRIYLGFHYPTDVVGGAILGVTVVASVNVPVVRNAIAGPVLALATRRPTIFYAASFLITLQAATLFIDVGPIARWSIAVASALMRGSPLVTAGGR